METALQKFLLLLFAVLFVLSGRASGREIGFEVDPSTYLKLPESCQSWFVGAARSGKVKGMSFAGIKPPINLQATIGGNATWMNHYCPALVSLIRYKDQNHDFLEPHEQRKRLSSILRGIDYQLPHSGGWFKAEVLRNKGHVLGLMGDPSSAVSAYQSAIEAYPPYLAAYWELATIFERSENYERAMQTLQDALEYTRTPSYKKEISDRIDQIRKLFEEKENLQESGTPTNVESLAPAVENPVTSKLEAG